MSLEVGHFHHQQACMHVPSLLHSLPSRSGLHHCHLFLQGVFISGWYSHDSNWRSLPSVNNFRYFVSWNNWITEDFVYSVLKHFLSAAFVNHVWASSCYKLVKHSGLVTANWDCLKIKFSKRRKPFRAVVIHLVLERWKWPSCHHQQGNCSHQMNLLSHAEMIPGATAPMDVPHYQNQSLPTNLSCCHLGEEVMAAAPRIH